jgi:hypothetical protein
MDILHDHTGPQMPFLHFWSLFDPQKYIFSSSINNFRSTEGSHNLFHFEPPSAQLKDPADSQFFRSMNEVNIKY